MSKRGKIIIISLALIAIVLTTVVLANYDTLYILYIKFTDPNDINIVFFAYTGNKLTLLQNVSVTIFAFYPTANGTVIKKIETAINVGYVRIPLNNLTEIAEHWIKHYGYKICPSLLGFASYTVNKADETIVYVQPFTVTISPYNITHGIGKTVVKLFINPKKFIVKKKFTPNETGLTNTTVPSKEGRPSLIICLNKVWFYPSNKSLGPIPLSIAYITDTNYNDYIGEILLKEGYSEASGIQFKFGVTILGYPVTVTGFSITTSANNLVLCKAGYFGEEGHSNFVEIYTIGQIAIASYCVYYYYCPSLPPVFLGYCNETFLTGLEVVGRGSSYLPALYNTTVSNLPPTCYFSNNLTFIGSVTPGNIHLHMCVSIATSNGFATYSVPIGLIIKLATILGLTIPSWISSLLLVISPYIGIVTFTNSVTYFASSISIVDLSSNTYYIYLMNDSVPYCIGGTKYYIPYYYYYINYTS
ncbi:hypothetical protein D1867_00515 [Acidianus infernus]|uniref:Uncharacterized protein n=1 Tax=Acidianus infernus TaxID=12915 RepID=A0A6A9Q972_ACIIN|nr:hypothetical protein [Acidianus infernus]MUM63761.1 hypothetical protein [Acidianus infernus]